MGFDLPTSSWRVKLYQLSDKEWLDRGTGFCNADVVDKRALLIVRNENDTNDVLLSSQVEGNMQYHKQQGTLIVWTEKDDKEMALSFQEPEGCSLICDFLVYVHNHLENQITVLSLKSQVTADGEGYELTELIVGPYVPPPDPAIGRLDYVLEAMTMAIRYPDERELTVSYIRDNNYVTKLIDVFHMAEDLESLDDLHNLCRIVKALLLLNDNSLYELLLNDDNILGIMGILEYDPEFPKHKANHRSYISDQVKFNEVVPITDSNIRNKIKQTFRLQFLKDVALARLLDEYTCSMIASMIYYNQTEIIRFIEENDEFSSSLFGLYSSPNVDEKMENGSLEVESSLQRSTNGDHVGEEEGKADQVVEKEERSDQADLNEEKSDQTPVTHEESDQPHRESDQTHDKSDLTLGESEKSVQSLGKHEESDQNISEQPSKRPKTTTSTTLLKKRRDGVRLLHQVSSIVKALQHQQRYTLYNKLVSRGMLKLVYFALNDTEDSGIRVLGTELLVALVEHDATFINNSNDDLGLRVLIDLFLEEEDASLKTQAADTLKTQLDMASSNAGPLSVNGPETEDQTTEISENKSSDRNGSDKNIETEVIAKVQKPLVGLVRKNKAKTTIQIEENIYKKWMPLLFKNLIELTEQESNEIIKGHKKLTFSQRIYYEKSCGILGFCLEQHHPKCQEFVNENNLWNSLKLLMKWPYRGIRLNAIQCIRKAVSVELSLEMLQSGVLRQFLKLMIEIGNVNNLLHSSCLSVLETIGETMSQISTATNSSSIAILNRWITDDSELFSEILQFKVACKLIETFGDKIQADDSNFTLTSDDEVNDKQDNITANRLKRPYEAIDEKRGLRQTLATAGKKLSMTFKGKVKK